MVVGLGTVVRGQRKCCTAYPGDPTKRMQNNMAVAVFYSPMNAVSVITAIGYWTTKPIADKIWHFVRKKSFYRVNTRCYKNKKRKLVAENG